ncbi:Tol-Pal system beta propeller repeat protein TolB [Uliginosibacterium sp. H3]|uniref:Tol-Pal system protein TolB n=1 Tax=Uliginosibacterium silvisoli TaxID=3114758 RepID=A0ABU6JZE8_9RHOO|nr:Tol-Pal system beta propeller repeat protein TolB [Uliginosibacterium sp. H3]
MHRRHFLQASSLLALTPALARAELTVEISGLGDNRIPVAITPFAGEQILPKSVSEVVRADLERSGLFRIIDAGSQPPADIARPSWDTWRSRSADILLGANVRRLADGNVEATFRLMDVVKQTELKSAVLSFHAEQGRNAGHWIADRVYEQMVGVPGIFSTQIAYVEKSGRNYMLQIAEYDGANPVSAFTDDEPIISPAWSPDGKRLAYVSFALKKPVIYVQTVATGRRQVVANFKGSNSAPAWAPDGNRLAIVLTKDGLSQLYIINVDGSGARRLTKSSAIDTEPCFSPDGRTIYFTSDRSGGPQTYRIPVDGSGEPQRVTFEGSYNVSPRVSPDGKTLAYVSRIDGRFQLMVQDLATQQTLALTDTTRDESPSFAPNGRLILYATEVGGRGVLSAVSVDGKIRYKPLQGAGNIREPAWGPLGG